MKAFMRRHSATGGRVPAQGRETWPRGRTFRGRDCAVRIASGFSTGPYRSDPVISKQEDEILDTYSKAGHIETFYLIIAFSFGVDSQEG